jgi:hypothetical protein
MHIEYTISEEDYLTAQKLAMRHLRPGQNRLMYQWMPAFGLILLGWILYTGFTQGFSTSLAPGLIVPIFLVSLLFTRNQTLRKAYAKAANMHGKLALDVNDDGLHFQGATFNSHVTWEHYSSFCEDQASFLFFQSNSIFNIVPKRQLSAEQAAALRELLRRHINENGKASAVIA